MKDTPLSNIDPMPVEEVDDDADWGRLSDRINGTDS
jgi:hypothetical protein